MESVILVRLLIIRDASKNINLVDMEMKIINYYSMLLENMELIILILKLLKKKQKNIMKKKNIGFHITTLLKMDII